jgi:hypothetical protein
MKAMLASGFVHATLMSPPFTQFSILLRFAIEIIQPPLKQSAIENNLAERIGIEPTSPLA